MSSVPSADGGPEPDLFWRNRGWWGRAGQASAGIWGSTLFAFLGTVAAARALGPSGYGAVVLAISVASLLSTFLDVTLEEAVVYHGQRALSGGRLGTLRALVRTSLVLDVAVGVVVAAVLVGLANPIADVVSAGRLDADLVRLAAIMLLAATADGTTGAMLMLADRVHVRAWIMALTNAVRLVGVIVAGALGGGAEAVVVAYAVASAIGSALQALVAWRLGWRRWRGGPSDGGDRVGIKPLALFGAHTSVSTSLLSARELLFPVLLGSLAGPAAIGLFSVAMFPVFLASVASSPIRLLLLPEQTKLAAEHRFADLWRSVRVHTLAGLSIGLPAATAGYFLLDWLIPLFFSEAFSSAVGAARILLVAAVCYFAFGWWKTLPAALGRPQIRTMLAGISLTLTLGLLALLGSSGSEGAALAVSVEAVVGGVFLLFLARRLLLAEAAPRPVLAEPSA